MSFGLEEGQGGVLLGMANGLARLRGVVLMTLMRDEAEKNGLGPISGDDVCIKSHRKESMRKTSHCVITGKGEL